MSYYCDWYGFFETKRMSKEDIEKSEELYDFLEEHIDAVSGTFNGVMTFDGYNNVYPEDFCDFITLIEPFTTKGEIRINGEDHRSWLLKYYPEDKNWHLLYGHTIFSEKDDEADLNNMIQSSISWDNFRSMKPAATP